MGRGHGCSCTQPVLQRKALGFQTPAGEKIWEPPVKEKKPPKGVLVLPSTPGSFALPGRAALPSPAAAAASKLAAERSPARGPRATPERQDGLPSFPRVWAGSRLGRAGPPGQHPAPLRACQGHGQGAAWQGREGKAGGVQLPTPCSLPVPSSPTLLPVLSPLWLLSPEKRCFPLPESPGDSLGKESSCVAPVGMGTGLQNSATVHRDLCGAKEVGIMVVTAPKLALESECCFGFFRRKWARAAETACAEVPKGTAISFYFSFSCSTVSRCLQPVFPHREPFTCAGPDSFGGFEV